MAFYNFLFLLAQLAVLFQTPNPTINFSQLIGKILAGSIYPSIGARPDYAIRVITISVIGISPYNRW